MKKQSGRFILSLIVVIVWLIVIFMFSNMNNDLSNGESKGILREITGKVVETFNIDVSDKDINNFVNKANYPLRKVMHASVYFILSLLILNVLRKTNIKKKYLITILICFIYACTDEFHQLFIDGRTGQLLDVMIDTMGSVIGSSIYYLIFRKINK